MLVPRNAWPVPQPTGAQGRMRVPRNLHCTRLISSNLLPWSKKVSSQPKFCIWMRRETLRDESQPWIGDTKKLVLMRKKVWCHELLIPCCATVLFLSIFLDFSSTALKISLLLSSPVRRVNLVVVDLLFKIEEFLREMAISLKNCRVKQQNQSFGANWTDWTLSSHYLLWFSDNLSVHLSLGSTAPFGRPSASSENSIILSLCLSNPAVSLSVLSKTQHQKVFSLNAGATKCVTSPAAHRGTG